MQNKILVIGHKGYVGTILTRYLKNNNKYKLLIKGIDTNFFSLNNYNKYKKSSIQNISIDCRKITLSKLSFKPNIIIYLAAVSNDPMGRNFKIATNDINYLTCIKLAKQAKEAERPWSPQKG